jgi:glucose-1-phosphate adenylyltransferase
VDAYYRANMELLDVTPQLNLYDKGWPIWTYQEQVPPAKFVFNDEGRRGSAVDSMVSGGCIVSGAQITRSLLFSNVRVELGSRIEECVVLPDAQIGANCRIRRAVVDRGCIIEPGTEIGFDAERDRKLFQLSPEGIVLVTPEALGHARNYVR